MYAVYTHTGFRRFTQACNIVNILIFVNIIINSIRTGSRGFAHVYNYYNNCEHFDVKLSTDRI